MSCNNSSGIYAFGNSWWWIIILIIIVVLWGGNNPSGRDDRPAPRTGGWSRIPPPKPVYCRKRLRLFRARLF